MKVKARDIIEGWPRGRSTLPSQLNAQKVHQHRRYHTAQQQMIDEYFATYRREPNELEAYILKHFRIIERYDPEEGKRVARESVLAAERLRNVQTWATNANVSVDAKITYLDYDLLRKIFGQ